VFALFVAWGPTLAFRQPVSIAVIDLLVVGPSATPPGTTRVPRQGTTPAASDRPIDRLRHRVGNAAHSGTGIDMTARSSRPTALLQHSPTARPRR
jgi:hypothetical protein